MINFFQHIPYLDGYNASVSEEEQLAAVIPTHFEPMGHLSRHQDPLWTRSPRGDAIAVPQRPHQHDPRLPAAGRRRPHLRARGNHAGKHRPPRTTSPAISTPTALSSTRPTRNSSPACAATWPSPSSTATTPPSPASTPTPTPLTPRPRTASPASPTSTSSPSSRRNAEADFVKALESLRLHPEGL